jgi:hypothetical protein
LHVIGVIGWASQDAKSAVRFTEDQKMNHFQSLDALVQKRLKTWPQEPPGLPARQQRGRSVWLRGRPGDMLTSSHPFLKHPGSNLLRTLPDGLWLNFGGQPPDVFVDIFAIEACASLANMLDKRARFAPSTHSLLAVCPVPWLLAPVVPGGDVPRWKATGLLEKEPTTPLVLPVRDIRVLYALKARHYKGFVESQVPYPHEYFMPMEALIAENSHQNPALQTLLARASASANFLEVS